MPIRAAILLTFVLTACCTTTQPVAREQTTDRLAIQDVITALFVKTDERDWKSVQDTFADKVKFDMTSLTGGEPKEETPQEITAGWETGLKDIGFIHHQGGNYRVWIHGNEADANAYAIAYHYKKKADNRNTRVFVGT